MHQMQATYGSKELFFCVFFLGSYELLCLLLSAAGMEGRKDREWRRMVRLHENLGNFGWVFGVAGSLLLLFVWGWWREEAMGGGLCLSCYLMAW